MFTTYTCVYNMNTDACINSTGQLMKLQASTGHVEWGYRFDGAGMYVGGFPSPPSFVPKTESAPALAVVLGSQSMDDYSGTMGYFAAGLPLRRGDEGVTCDVPLESGNRLDYPVNASTRAQCRSAGACWDGSDDRCDLVPTAMTEDCASPNPVVEAECTDKGCCWQEQYRRCYKGSPKCYEKSENPEGGWQTPRPGPKWTSRPAAVATDARRAVEADRLGCHRHHQDYIVVMAKCDTYLPTSGCAVEAFDAQGTETGQEGTTTLWQYPLAAKCDVGTKACMCQCGEGECVSDPAIGDGGVFLKVCDAKGVVLLALDLSSGTELSEPARLHDFDIPGRISESYPALVFSPRFNLIISGLYLPDNYDVINAFDTKTGKSAWNMRFQSRRCSSMRWTETGALTPDGEHLLVWENFTIRAVSAKTGEPVWTSTGYSAAGKMAPGVSFASSSGKKADVALVSANDGPNTCDDAFLPGIFVQAIDLRDGRLVGRARSPSTEALAAALPPVSVRDLWIYTEADPAPPRMFSTIYALKANYTKDEVASS